MLGYVYQCIGQRVTGYHYWREEILSTLGSIKNVFQSCIPSVYVDNRGTLHTLFMSDISSSGPFYEYRKCTFNNGYVETSIHPWSLMDSYSLSEHPYLETFADDNFYFKNYIHNIFNPCIAQNVGEDSEYLNAFCYVSPARFQSASDTEGILWFKIKKSNGSINKVNFYTGIKKDNHFSFHHQKPRRPSDSYVYQPEMGNYQAWEDNGNVHLNWIATEKAKEFDTARMYQLYNGSVAIYSSVSSSNSGGYLICPRIVKYNDSIFMVQDSMGRAGILKYSSTDLSSYYFLSWSYYRTSPFLYLDHSSSENVYTARNYDFCIVDNPDNPSKPIFCVLGLRPADSTSTSKTSLNWTNTYVNWGTSDIVLILSSYAWDTNSFSWADQPDVAEDPQNIIYTTGQTSFQDSCSVDCVCYSDKNDVEYHEKQLFKNTHKICTYTSSCGNKYLIYCYCYPGKTKQLYLGYATYWVSNNKIHLGTKFEFRASSAQWSESFDMFRYCTRIVSLDCKNGYIWITWMDDGCFYEGSCRYFSFHILAKDLVGE